MIQYGLKSLDIRYLTGEDDLKKYFLYFDKIYFDSSGFELNKMISESLIKTYYKNIDSNNQIKLKTNEIDFLINRGLLIEFKNRTLEKIAYDRNIMDFVSFFEDFKKKGPKLFSSIDTMHFASIMRITQNILNGTTGNPDDAFQSYFSSLLLNKINNIDITPIFEDNSLNKKSDLNNDLQTLTFVLKNLPAVDETVSWEQVIEFKQDKENMIKFRELRNWMIDISSSNNLTSNQIEEKFEYLYNEYIYHLKKHKLNTRTGSIKSIFFTTIETIENIATLKWSKVVRELFEIIDEKTKLNEIETSAPGKEIGFIYKANEKFNKHK